VEPTCNTADSVRLDIYRWNKYYIIKVKRKVPAGEAKVKRAQAFTLVEVLISVVILSIALLAIFHGNISNLRSAKQAQELQTAAMAAESVLKEMLKKGYPESGSFEGAFEEEYYRGIKWRKNVETLQIPGVNNLKTVTVTVEYGSGKTYVLETVISRY
jgi:type II secretion system protein I